jgi:4-amino-4-deoxy-L-arabinose transferase-like glycosyltransferase
MIPSDECLGATAWERTHARHLRRLALLLLLLGLAWRCTRYLLGFPLWLDETLVMVNYIGRDYRSLLGPIRNCQIAPLLFHVLELTAFRWLGPSEWAVRLPPFLACLGGVALFWALARLTLPPLAATLAVGIFAASSWPATMGSFCKPYALDLFFSLALLVPAAAWLRRPTRLWPLIVLTVVAPVAMAGSYPAVFIGGAVALTLGASALRRRDRRALACTFALGLILTAAFLAHYLLVGRVHLASPAGGTTTAVGMRTYWQEGFPPTRVFPFLRWFALINTGQVAAYPLGSANGGSVATVVLTIVGLIWAWRHGRRGLVSIVLLSFALWFLAAVLQKYPYAASGRLSQHVAPFYCLFAAAGMAALMQRFRPQHRLWLGTLILAGCLGLICVGGTAYSICKPYRDQDSRWARQVAHQVLDDAGRDPVVFAQDRPAVPPEFQWQFGSRTESLFWGDQLNWAAAGREGSVWVVVLALWPDDPPPRTDLPQWLAQLQAADGTPWHCVTCRTSLRTFEDIHIPAQHARWYHLVRG